MHAWTAIATFDFRLSGGFESVPHCLINLILVVVGTYSSHDWRNQEEAGLNMQAHVKLVFLLCLLTVTRPSRMSQEAGCRYPAYSTAGPRSTVAKGMGV